MYLGTYMLLVLKVTATIVSCFQTTSKKKVINSTVHFTYKCQAYCSAWERMNIFTVEFVLISIYTEGKVVLLKRR